MIALVFVVIGDDFYLGFEITRQEVIFQQDAVLHSLLPRFDLTLGVRMIA